MAPSRNTKPILSAKFEGFGVLSETVRKSWSGGFLSFMILGSRFRASGFKIFSFEALRLQGLGIRVLLESRQKDS